MHWENAKKNRGMETVANGPCSDIGANISKQSRTSLRKIRYLGNTNQGGFGFLMAEHTHNFVEEYDGLVGFGFDREGDENTVAYYLQKFSDDAHMALIKKRMTQEELEEVFNLLTRLLKTHLSEEEYHGYFLKDRE